jgi:hypothetical protein
VFDSADVWSLDVCCLFAMLSGLLLACTLLTSACGMLREAEAEGKHCVTLICESAVKKHERAEESVTSPLYIDHGTAL